MDSFWQGSRSKSDQMIGSGTWTEVSIAVVIATVPLLLLAVLIRRPRRRLPPGPPRWPILGNLLSLGTMPHESLYKLSKQYGPLMLINLGSVRTIVVTSPDVAEEILKKNDQIMASRPTTIAVDLFFGTPSSNVAWAPYGEYWRNVRKICTVGLLTATRINDFREIRYQEVLATLNFILGETQRGNPVNMDQCFATLTENNITQMMMKKSYCCRTSSSKSGVPAVTSGWFHEVLRDVFIFFSVPNIGDGIPLLKPFDLQGLQKRGKELQGKLYRFFQEVIDERRQSLSTGTPENYKEDFLDSLLGFGQTKEFQEQLSNETVKALLLDMFAAASDTSATTAQWGLTEIMRHPKVMRKVQQELDSVVGTHRLVQEDDLPKLKYLRATVNETLRLHPPGPFLLPHESTQDCEIQGFHIPAKTRIMTNIWAIHRDPVLWERPLEFDPDRFLNSTIDFRGQDFKFIPFGSGRRMCPGINLGMMMVLYPLAVLLHALDWTTVEGERPEDLDISEEFGIVLFKRLPLIVHGKARLPNNVIYPTQEVEK